MPNDLTVAVSDKAVLNVRVGAIIMKQGEFLMVGTAAVGAFPCA